MGSMNAPKAQAATIRSAWTGGSLGARSSKAGQAKKDPDDRADVECADQGCHGPVLQDREVQAAGDPVGEAQDAEAREELGAGKAGQHPCMAGPAALAHGCSVQDENPLGAEGRRWSIRRSPWLTVNAPGILAGRLRRAPDSR